MEIKTRTKKVKTGFKYEKVKLIELSDWNGFIVSVYGKPYKLENQKNFWAKKSKFVFSVPIQKDILERSLAKEMDVLVFLHETSTFGDSIPIKVWEKTDVGKFDVYFPKRDENVLFWENKYFPDIYVLFDDLHKKGLIKKGKYMILL